MILQVSNVSNTVLLTILVNNRLDKYSNPIFNETCLAEYYNTVNLRSNRISALASIYKFKASNFKSRKK